MPENFNDRPHKNEKADSIAYVKGLIEQMRADGKSDDIPKLEKLIQLLNSKKYGLVWEEHAELVEEEMKTKIPVFVEDESKKIHDNPDSEDFNFLLEGDNLHSLHLLEKTHAGKIDVIYIDPPYNTGKEFTYNDKVVDKTDGYSHSKWLSFMERRLNIAQQLLSDSGAIFISIDDNEEGNLRLLLDEIFGENNFISRFVIQSNPRGSNASKYIAQTDEYLFMYSKNYQKLVVDGYQKTEENISEYNQEDDRGKYRLLGLRARGGEWRREQRPKMYYPIYVNPENGAVSLEKTNEYVIESLPKRPTGEESRWTWSKEKFLKESSLLVGRKVNRRGQENFYDVFRKDYLEKDGEEALTKPRSIWDEKEMNYQNGKESLKSLGLIDKFDFPKPTYLIKKVVTMFKDKNLVIMDFFAGSGTTGQAVTELNTEDGGSRKFILATNNENNIAEEVTYERMKRVSSGTEKYEAKPMNLKYFKTDFVVKEKFPDVSLEYELLKYITPLVELEFAIDITNPKVQIVLNEDQLEALIENNELISDSTLFMHPDVFRDAEQNQILSDLQIKVQEIPNYFFGKELWSK
ncbi:site-specific DNA-methyltransferase [Lactococcus lactis]|uniref:site-specific DNA-methyltransferase n=1 Tax=Lactococcus lactis TaxID=1358 RepID=UPI00223A9F45|nr:site-specific DNA-methyltransferase [Lactococcus lactis]MCT1193500.1 site-specific DNA-methyltransferase [Lactococcus lactis]